MVNQCRHRVFLGGGRGTAQTVGHIVVVVCHRSEIHRQSAIVAVGVAMAVESGIRPLPITDNLRHGSRHTPRVNMTARPVKIRRTLQVVILVLIPCGLKQRAYGCNTSGGDGMSSSQKSPFLRDLSGGLDIVVHRLLNLFPIMIQPTTHIVGHPLHHKRIVV